ncbi:MAG TPA: hypothetical protein VFE25_13285 [Opitutaceae bacterium]|jgi:hypothetical protein|nr:hypothetical protein [Opitutaceae bacterium]
MRTPIRLGIPFLAFVLAKPGLWAKPLWPKVSAAELADNAPTIDPEAPAEILDYRIDIDDTEERARDITTTTRIKIFDPARAVDVTRIAHFWNGYSDEYYDVKARLTLPDGTTRDFDRHDLRERNVAEEGKANGFFGRLLAHNDRSLAEKFLAVTGVVKGAVLDVWEFRPGEQKSDWMVTTAQRPDAPIRSFEYTDHFMVDSRRFHRTFVINPSGGHMSHDEKAHTISFTAQNLPAIHREPFAPPAGFLSLAIVESYESVTRYVAPRSGKVRLPEGVPASLGEWAFYATAQDYQDADKGYADKKVKEKAAELTAGIADPRAKVQRIYDYTQELYSRFRNRADFEDSYTRYIESVGELIDLNHMDSTFLRREDFVFLFIGLVRSAGVECHSAFHPLRSGFPFKMDMVSPNFLPGWSVAVKLGDTWMLCDPCTDVPLGLGELPWDMEGVPALVALPRQQVFLGVPVAPAAKSLSEATVDVSLDDDGNLEGTCTRTFTGHSAYIVREKLKGLGEEGWNGLAKDILGLQASSCEVTLTGVDGLESPQETMTLRAKVYWPSYAPVLGDRMPVILSVWTQGRPPILNSSKRQTPVAFHFPTIEKETITLHLPADFLPGPMPKPISAGSGEFAYQLSAEDAGHGVLKVTRESKINAVYVLPDKYPSLLDWFRRISVADQTTVVLQRAPKTASSP